MGCVASKLEEEEEVVAICRERKRQLKLAVDRRYVLAEAHWKYNQSLFAVAAAIKLFVARHSSPSSPFLITFPEPSTPSTPSENVINNPMFLQQTPSESTQKAIACHHAESSSTSSDSYEEREEKCMERDEQVCGYYYMQMPIPPQMPSPQRDFGWDFFNPFDGVRPEVMNGFSRCSEEELRAVREQEGIPELEEEGEREEEVEDTVVVVEENGNGGMARESGIEAVGAVNSVSFSQGEQKGLTVIDTPEMGRELLEALKDIEDYFIRAHDSGKDVSRMLEANKVHMHSGLEEIKGVIF